MITVAEEGDVVVVVMKTMSGMEKKKLARDWKRCEMVRRPVTWIGWIWDYFNDITTLLFN